MPTRKAQKPRALGETMTEESANTDKDESPPGSNGTAAPMDEIRRLLLTPEQTQIRRIQERIEDPKVNAEMVSRVLPDAAVLRAQKDDRLTTALLPTVEGAIELSVRQRPEVLAGAIFPVLGPAIRKAIAATLGAMLASLNQTLENSLSPRSLRWRWESWRTGRPFTEVVLLRTLEYRVEQVFLIHRGDGLLLEHVAAVAPTALGPEMISAMLTAIQDFIRDSFRVQESDEVGSLQVGDLKVWIEGGPHAVLAAVIRGEAPSDLRVQLQETVEVIHRQFATELEQYNGDSAPFESSRELLERCVTFRLREKRTSSLRAVWIALAGAAIFAAILLVPRLLKRNRWLNYVETLKAQPGIVVIEAEARRGKYQIVGLRDPLASDPSALLRDARLRPENVEARWEPYAASYPPFVVNRAKDLLAPPAGVSLRAENGVLYATGAAPQSWIDEARRQSRFVGGIERYDDAQLVPENAARDLEREYFEFAPGQSELRANESERLSKIVEKIRQILSSGEHLKKHVRIVIIGQADRPGSEAENERISQARADAVLQRLVASGLPREAFATSGLGTRQSGADDRGSSSSSAIRRAVSFRVELRPN